MSHAKEVMTKTVILIGCGQMGSALAGGLVASGRVQPSNLICIDARKERAEALAERLGARAAAPNTAVSADKSRARYWVVAVKPKDVDGVLASYRDDFESTDTVISLAAGLTLARLRSSAGHTPQIVRTMPNTPALVSQGVTGIMSDGDTDLSQVRELFESVGEVVELEREADFDALTAVSGSGPAYIFTAIEALADGGVRMGLSREVSRKLAAQTVAGAAALVQSDPGTHTAELKDRVASPAGTTIAGLATLEKYGFRHALISAVEAAALRSREMGDD